MLIKNFQGLMGERVFFDNIDQARGVVQEFEQRDVKESNYNMNVDYEKDLVKTKLGQIDDLTADKKNDLLTQIDRHAEKLKAKQQYFIERLKLGSDVKEIAVSDVDTLSKAQARLAVYKLCEELFKKCNNGDIDDPGYGELHLKQVKVMQDFVDGFTSESQNRMENLSLSLTLYEGKKDSKGEGWKNILTQKNLVEDDVKKFQQMGALKCPDIKLNANYETYYKAVRNVYNAQMNMRGAIYSEDEEVRDKAKQWLDWALLLNNLNRAKEGARTAMAKIQPVPDKAREFWTNAERFSKTDMRKAIKLYNEIGPICNGELLKGKVSPSEPSRDEAALQLRGQVAALTVKYNGLSSEKQSLVREAYNAQYGDGAFTTVADLYVAARPGEVGEQIQRFETLKRLIAREEGGN